MRTQRQPDPRNRQRGASFLELMVAISIVGVALLVMLQQLSISHRETEIERDRVFAYQKGLAILNELQAAVERGLVTNANDLESLADVEDSPVLTTLRDESGAVLPPDHPSSGNIRRLGQWVWNRRVEIHPTPGNPRLRRIQVSVRKPLRDGGPVQTFAAVATLLNLPDESGPTSQAYDLYVLALNAVPSSYMSVPSLRGTFQAAIDEISQRAPGLRFRVHWITELGYGRDPGYVPYFNTTEGATFAAPSVYWYPSKCDQVTPALFAPELFGSVARTDAGIMHGYDPTTNPYPHTTADRFNHARRYPEASKLFDARVAAGTVKATEPPLQILLEQMYAQPERYRNAIFINLHGEVIPYPPLRNYSDPARDPVGHSGVRVVTHPGRIRPERDPDGDGNHADTRPVELRVYAYKENTALAGDLLDAPITLRIFGVDLTRNVNGSASAAAPTLEIHRLIGGVDPDTGTTLGPSTEYAAFDDPEGVAPQLAARTHPHEMAYECGFVAAPEPFTWIKLHDTPVVAPAVDMRGLLPTSRLYGLEYIPSPIAFPVPTERDFPIDLASDGLGPKNTARWRIRIPADVFEAGFDGLGFANTDQLVTIDTRIGTELGTGTMWPTPLQPWNVSTTWAWWARTPDAVPLTERYQILGDPRHNPYVDLCADGSSFPNGYDWYFDDLRDGLDDACGDWPCLHDERLRDGFGPGVFFDVPRIAQVWRTAMMRATTIFTSFGGRMAGSVSIGGDWCLPAEPGQVEFRTLPVHGAVYGITGYAAVDTLTPDDPSSPAAPGAPATFPKLGAVYVVGNSNTFWARPWLGELWPDSAVATWSTEFNLSTNPSSGGYHRVPRQEALLPAIVPAGTNLTTSGGGRTHETGAATLLQFGTSFSTFAQKLEVPLSTAIPEPAVRDLFLAVGVGLGESVPVRWTHGLAATLPTPLPHLAWVGDYPDQYCQELERLARGPSLRSSSATLRLTAPSAIERAFFALVGETPQGSLEQERLVRSSVLQGLHSLWVAGHPAFDNDIAPVARVLVTGPEQGIVLDDPAEFPLKWRTSFERFDGARFTTSYPESAGGDESKLRYRVMYSSDGGMTWRDTLDNAVDDPMRRPAMEPLLPDSGFGDELFSVPVPAASFPTGDYIFRVVAHNTERHPHIAWHDLYAKIVRPAPADPKDKPK